jgi:anti-sigma factor RsiW
VDCEDLHSLLHGYVDGELDLVHNLEVERHLKDCPACTEAVEGCRALSNALADADLTHRAPAALRERVRAALPKPAPARLRRPRSWLPLGFAASIALVAAGAWTAARFASTPSHEDQTAQEVVSNHIRSLMAEHLFDVASSDQHTVKPWFNRKVDFAPEVKNFQEDGFPLLGGRLDYLDGKKTAALIYQRRQHYLNVFIQPAPDGEAEPPRALTRQGYHLFHWSRDGLRWWVVSDLNAEELRGFVDLLRK